MKKIVLAINLSILIILLGTVLFFLWQLKNNIDLKKELTQKAQLLKEIETTSRHLKELEVQSRDLKQKAEALYKRVPVDEKQPLSLIKVLINIGGEIGLRKISFSVKEESIDEKDKLSLISGVSGQGSDLSKGGPMQEAAVPVQSAALAVSGVAQIGPKPLYLEMNFEGTFPQLLDFLKKLNNLERIVTVSAIEIKRSEEALPYQKISLQLADRKSVV